MGLGYTYYYSQQQQQQQQQQQLTQDKPADYRAIKKVGGGESHMITWELISIDVHVIQ